MWMGETGLKTTAFDRKVGSSIIFFPQYWHLVGLGKVGFFNA